MHRHVLGNKTLLMKMRRFQTGVQSCKSSPKPAFLACETFLYHTYKLENKSAWGSKQKKGCILPSLVIRSLATENTRELCPGDMNI